MVWVCVCLCVCVCVRACLCVSVCVLSFNVVSVPAGAGHFLACQRACGGDPLVGNGVERAVTFPVTFLPSPMGMSAGLILPLLWGDMHEVAGAWSTHTNSGINTWTHTHTHRHTGKHAYHTHVHICRNTKNHVRLASNYQLSRYITHRYLDYFAIDRQYIHYTSYSFQIILNTH